MSIRPIQGSVPPPVPQRQPAAEARLTPEEKQFFEGLYPEAAGDIRSHETYNRTGMSHEVRLGSMIDRKG